jgi:hypothetical protein
MDYQYIVSKQLLEHKKDAHLRASLMGKPHSRRLFYYILYKRKKDQDFS